MKPNHYERQWHLHGRHPTANISSKADLGCEDFWSRHGTGSAEIVVALADDGVDIHVPGLDQPGKFAGHAHHDGETWRVHGGQTHADLAQCPFGGTHGNAMAALIAAAGGNRGQGVAPGCRLFPIRLPMHKRQVILTEPLLDEMLGIIDRHADVALLPFVRHPVMHFSRNILDRMAAMGQCGGRRGKGVVFVFPAGNANCPIHVRTSAPVSFGRAAKTDTPLQSRRFRNAFAELECKLHVSAITAAAQKAFYSCYGPGIDICAPSSCERPFSKEKTANLPGLATVYHRDGLFSDNFKGTSGAAALVTGAAALLRGLHPDATATDIVATLKAQASKSLDETDIYGLIQLRPWEQRPPDALSDGSFDQRGWSPWFGYGKTDLRLF